MGLSSYFVYFFKLKLILFFKRVIYYYTRTFLILLPQPLYIYIYIYGLVSRVFPNGPRDLSSIPGRVIPKIIKIVLDTSLLSTQLYKLRIMGKVEQSRERSSALLLHLDIESIEKGAFWSPLTRVANSTTIYIYIYKGYSYLWTAASIFNHKFSLLYSLFSFGRF